MRAKFMVNLLCGTAGALAVLLASQALSLDKNAPPPPKVKVEAAPLNRTAAPTTASFAPVIKQASPSVVYVYTTKTVRENQRMEQLFMDPMFRQFFDQDPRSMRPRERHESGLGSGVIVSEDGYILTNNHVVEDADEVRVSLASSREEYVAKVVGTDPATDIAVLKIEGKNLPAITMTDSDHLLVGDVVLAIGNPFGVGQTVTMGIVSAVGRKDLRIVDYENFIQTDASINPGNSGGALIDAQGRLVGINTAILSRTGGNQGIGFAVPVNLARAMMDQIVKEGRVIRGYLGINLQGRITPDLAKAFRLPDSNGALVAQVLPNSPADKGGMKEGDVVVEFNGRKVSDSSQFRFMVSQTAPNTKVNLKVLRDSKERALNVTLGELPVERMAQEAPGRQMRPSQPESQRIEQDLLDGIEVADLNPRARRQFNLPSEVQGALVMNVEPESPAARAGIRPGDVLQSINHQTVASADQAVQLGQTAGNGSVLLKVWSRGGSQFVVLTPKARHG